MPKTKSAVEQRREQILKRQEHIRQQLATKTRKHFKTEKLYEQWQRQWPEMLADLDAELSILEDPGEYDELPVAVVADELGLTLDALKGLINLCEVEASGKAPGLRISRSELGRICEMGVAELCRLGRQESAEIFEEAIPLLHGGDVPGAERAYRRIDARDTWRGLHAPAFLLALELAKGELEDARVSFKYMNERDPADRAILMSYLGRLLRGMRLRDHGAQALLEHILSIAEGGEINPYDGHGHRPKVIGKHLGDTQRRAAYLAAAVKASLEKYRHLQQFKFYHDRGSRMNDEEFDTLIRDAIYTALHAEETYDESAASKTHVAGLLALVPRWWAPAKLLVQLPTNKRKDV